MEQNIALALAIVTASTSMGFGLRANRRLTALRRNCFVTNEKGWRVRYVNASPEVRERAESN